MFEVFGTIRNTKNPTQPGKVGRIGSGTRQLYRRAVPKKYVSSGRRRPGSPAVQKCGNRRCYGEGQSVARMSHAALLFKRSPELSVWRLDMPLGKPKPTMRPELKKKMKKKASNPKLPSILNAHARRHLGISIGDDPLFVIMLGLFHFKMIGCAEELEEDCNVGMIEKLKVLKCCWTSLI